MNQDNNHLLDDRRESKNVFIPEPEQKAPAKVRRGVVIAAILLGAVSILCLVLFVFVWGSNMSDAADETNTQEDYDDTSNPDEDKPIIITDAGLTYTLTQSKDAYTVVGIEKIPDTNFEIVIPETYKGLPVTSIGGSAFEGCTNLTSITIPDSVTSIGYCAFFDCINLSTVYYTGTSSEWNRISIGGLHTHLASATRYYLQ